MPVKQAFLRWRNQTKWISDIAKTRGQNVFGALLAAFISVAYSGHTVLIRLIIIVADHRLSVWKLLTINDRSIYSANALNEWIAVPFPHVLSIAMHRGEFLFIYLTSPLAWSMAISRAGSYFRSVVQVSPDLSPGLYRLLFTKKKEKTCRLSLYYNRNWPAHTYWWVTHTLHCDSTHTPLR